MPARDFDTTKFIHAAQVGGIESYTLADGPGRGVRALCFDTGAGLRFRVMVDRGMDIERAAFNANSLTHLSHIGVTPPTRALDRGADWLKSYFVGLLTCCGPFNSGAPSVDQGQELGLHGVHSNTAATLESITQPDPRRGVLDFGATGVLRYGSYFGPNLELRRTISCALGQNVIHVRDSFFNAANDPTPHAWLLHINFGYPLIDEGAELCFDAQKVEPIAAVASKARFSDLSVARRCPAALDEHHGANETFAYLYPRLPDASGRVTVGVVNAKLGLGVAIRYDARQFPRVGNWQHFGKHEYVTALEPMTGGVEGRAIDRERGWLQYLAPDETRVYEYEIEAINDAQGLTALTALNH